ncbi:MAG TPA: PilX N-terminal domain-containing pilus assembly protein [Casimicrobiaceae bacterium]|nr:PilX N-terminal domain-containing pilus assembly protein [Casimicrobiaceae bacterium]
MKFPSASRERGAALIMVLIMLMVLAWFGLSSMRMSGQHLQIVGNSQARQQAIASAQRAIEVTISSNAFALDPRAVAASPIDTDIDGDGYTDYRSTLNPPPKCSRVRPIKTSQLDVALALDRVCLVSSDSGGTSLVDRPTAVVASGDSLCASSDWDLAARVTDTRSGASTQIRQGVGIRVSKYEAANYCK